MTSSSISLPGSWDTTRSKALADLIHRSLRQLTSSHNSSHKPANGPNRIARQHQVIPETSETQNIPSWEQRFLTSMQILGRESPRIHNIVESLWGRTECSQYLQKMILDCCDVAVETRVGFKVETVAAFMLLLELHEVQFGTAR